MTQEQDQGRSLTSRATSPEDGRPGGLSCDASSQQAVSPVPASIPDAQTWILPFDDGGERWRVKYDTSSPYFNDVVRVRPNENRHSEIYLRPEDARWLAYSIMAAAQAIEARRAVTLGAVHESAVGATDAPDNQDDSWVDAPISQESDDAK